MQEIHLGKKIQVLRSERGLSVRKLAAASGITASMLSQIENEQVNPSIQTLRGLAGALKVPLYDFFREDSPQITVVTPESRMTIGRKNEPDVVYELLTPDAQGSIEFCMMVIPARSASSTEPQCHTGEEVAFVHAGSGLELELEGTRYPMAAGDSIRIPGQSKHVWHNSGDEPAQVIFALSPPSF